MSESLPGNMQTDSLQAVQVKYFCNYFIPSIT